MSDYDTPGVDPAAVNHIDDQLERVVQLLETQNDLVRELIETVKEVAAKTGEGE